MEMLIDVILDTLLDAAKLFPFLLLTYIAMELLEHHAGDKSVAWLKKQLPICLQAASSRWVR